MNTATYQQEVMRTCGPADEHERILASGLGIAGEAGEIADTIKKVMYHDHDYNEEKIVLELGDLLWYMALLCNTLDITLDAVMEQNIAKLRRRYPNGFDTEKSKHREQEGQA